MEIVQIKELRFQTIVGCWDWERQLPQQVNIDLDMAWDFSKSVETEKLEYALDYKAVSQRVEAFVVDQEKLLKLVRDLYQLAESDDDKRIEELEEQIRRLEEPLELRIEEFHLERELIAAREEGENVQELEAELQEIRNALRELRSGAS